MAQTRRGRQNETMDITDLSPETTSSREIGTTGDAAPSTTTGTNVVGSAGETIQVDPNNTITQSFITSMKVVPSPKDASDLFEFVSSITRILRRSPKTARLLEPLTGDDPGLERLSSSIYNEIWTRVPESLFGRIETWNPDTYSFLQKLRKRTPAIHKVSQYKTVPPLYIFPTRKKTETFAQYSIRFWSWKEHYLPCEYPEVVRYLASCIWVNHSQLYNIGFLSDKFATAIESFKTTADGVNWFRKQQMLQIPVAASGHSSAQGSKQGQKGNSQKQGSSQKSHPVPANKDGNTQNTTSGNVNKNGNNNSKTSGKKWRKKKGQTQQSSTDAGNQVTDMMQGPGNFVNAVTENVSDSGSWLIDSGSARTCTPELSELQFPQPISGISCYTVSGQRVDATHTGFVTFTFPSQSGKKSLTIIVRALCVPTFTQRVFAATALQGMRLEVFSDENSYSIRNKTSSTDPFIVSTDAMRQSGGSVFYYVDKAKLNRLQLKSIPSMSPIQSDFHVSASQPSGLIQYWHHKLGHASSDRVKQVLKFLDISLDGNMRNVDCPSCAKHSIIARKKQPRQTPLSTRPLQVIHADLSGISRTPDDDQLTPSLAGFRCFLLLKDDYTKYLWFIPLKEKSKAAEEIVDFIVMMQRFFPNHPIERVWSDQGSEFVTSKLTRFLRGKGIEHTLTPVATPAINGRIEREMRTVKEKGRALLTHSELPASMWRHAYAHATWLQNLLPRHHEPKRPHSVNPFYDLFSVKFSPEETREKLNTMVQTSRIFGVSGYVANVKRATVDGAIPRGLEAIWCGVKIPGSSFVCYVPALAEVADYPEAHFTPRHEQAYLFSRILSEIVSGYNSTKNGSLLQYVQKWWGPSIRAHNRILADRAVLAGSKRSASMELNSETESGQVVTPLETNCCSVNGYFVSGRSSTSTYEKNSLRRSREELERHEILCGVHEEKLNPEALAVIALLDINTPIKDDPETYKDAMGLPDAVEWKQACDVEMHIIHERDVFDLVEPPKGVHILTNRWVLKKKLSDTGIPLRYKARLVVRGFNQQYGIDYEDTFAEVVSIDLLRLMLAIAVHRSWHIEQLDVKSAFLYGDLDHVVYMRQPQGYEDGTNRVCRLKKSLYGLKQAPRQWFTKLSSILKGFEFEKVSNFSGLFACEVDQTRVYIVVYVDDLLIMSAKKAANMHVKSLIEKEIDVTSSGFPESYLSLHIEKTSTGITIDGRKNVNKLLSEFKDIIEKCTFKKAPPILPSEAERAILISLLDEKSPQWTPELSELAKSLDDWRCQKYRSAVGSLNYIMSKCRPDLAFATSQLSIHLQAPNELHWRMLLRTLVYLQRTKDAKLEYRRCGKPKLVGYTDATFRGAHVMHPHGGFVWKYGGCVFHWAARRERRACASIHEAELRCLINALEYGHNTRNLLVRMHLLENEDRSVLYTDSQSSFNVMNNDRISRETLRLYVHFDLIRDFKERAKIDVVHCKGDENVADALTKPLSEPMFRKAALKWLQL